MIVSAKTVGDSNLTWRWTVSMLFPPQVRVIPSSVIGSVYGAVELVLVGSIWRNQRTAVRDEFWNVAGLAKLAYRIMTEERALTRIIAAAGTLREHIDGSRITDKYCNLKDEREASFHAGLELK